MIPHSELAIILTQVICDAKRAKMTAENGKGVFTRGDLRAAIEACLTQTDLLTQPPPKKARRVKASASFAPPTPADVTEYAQSLGYPLDGADFCNSYEAKGWMIGKVKMKSWRHAVANWKTHTWGKLLSPRTDKPIDYANPL